ncbi:MAG: hypothetical protein DMF00_14320 [Verrucomicrobia bacterium]|nr:MAG: hypothetical protein DMF00_14320 [Verrucomicrobiota bacterium]
MDDFENLFTSSQRLMPTDEQSGLQAHIATMGSVSSCGRMTNRMRFWNSNRRFGRTISAIRGTSKTISPVVFPVLQGGDELSINAIPQTLVICVVA